MPTDVPVLDYAPAPPRFPGFVRRLLRGARWCWDNRHHLSGVAACFIACEIIWVTFNARIILATSRDGGRSEAWAGLHRSKWAIAPIIVLWIGARRSPWSKRLARTSFVIALIWWLYIQYKVHGGKGMWYW